MRYYKKQTRCWAQIPARRAASIVPRRHAAASMRAVMHHRLLLRVFPAFLMVAVCDFGLGCSSSPASQSTPTFNFAWDWTGIVGTGQSLSVGDLGTPVIAISNRTAT